jgi:hypothetical protein
MLRPAARLDDAAAALSAAGRSLRDEHVPADAFGADAGGLPGELGRALHAHWVAVCAARADEADATSTQLSDVAAALRTVADRYETTDDLVRRRLRRAP